MWVSHGEEIFLPRQSFRRESQKAYIQFIYQIYKLHVRIYGAVAMTSHLHTHTASRHKLWDPTHLFNDEKVSNLDVGALHLHCPCKERGPRHITYKCISIPHAFAERPRACKVNMVYPEACPSPAQPTLSALPASLGRDSPAPGTNPHLLELWNNSPPHIRLPVFFFFF